MFSCLVSLRFDGYSVVSRTTLVDSRARIPFAPGADK